MHCAQAYYVVSAGPKNERPIARQFRQWLLDEAGKAEVSINEGEFI
jgi:LysR family glycine cleavage system transcriptional activator